MTPLASQSRVHRVFRLLTHGVASGHPWAILSARAGFRQVRVDAYIDNFAGRDIPDYDRNFFEPIVSRLKGHTGLNLCVSLHYSYDRDRVVRIRREKVYGLEICIGPVLREHGYCEQGQDGKHSRVRALHW